MINAKQAKEAFAGFAGMANMPFDRAVVQKRIDALKRYARSEGHAARVVAQIRENQTFFPNEQQIIEACETSPDDGTLIQASRDCPHCRGEVYIAVTGPFGLSAAYRCTHQRAVPDSVDSAWTVQGEGGEYAVSVGLKLSPSLVAHYQQEHAAAEIRRAAWRSPLA